MGYPVRPSGYIGWCSTGATNVAEPTDAKKAVGWSINEQPPSSYFNWFQSKADEWLQYLAWKDSLKVVVADDFVRGASGIRGYTLAPEWNAAGDEAQVGVEISAVGISGDYDDNIGARYFSNFKSTPTHYNELRTIVHGMNGREFSMEFIYKELTRGDTGTTMEFGFFVPSHAIASGFGPECGFVSTGPSGTWAFQWKPSGAAAAVSTSVSLGVAPATDLKFHKLTAEARGPTMAIYYDDVLKVSAPYNMFKNGPSYNLAFGMRAHGPSMANSLSALIDRMELLVKR